MKLEAEFLPNLFMNLVRFVRLACSALTNLFFLVSCKAHLAVRWKQQCDLCSAVCLYAAEDED